MSSPLAVAAPVSVSTPVYRIRWVIRATRDIRIPPRQGAMIYALLAAANKTDEFPAAFPRDLLLDVPEENRMLIRSGEPYAFGGTLLANSPEEADAVLDRLRIGLERVGVEGKPRREGLGGNFRLHLVQDLIGQCELTDQVPVSLDVDVISREIQSVIGREELTLKFLAPLRLERQGQHKREHESFFNRQSFDAPYFIRRLLRRMATVGMQPRSDDVLHGIDSSTVQVIENRLVWLDLAYGGPYGKSLGGAVGKVRLRVAPSSDLIVAALVWGQWTRVGKNTHFGFGRYRIEELGSEPFATPRAISLLDLAWASPLADKLSSKAGMEAGVLTQTVRAVADGTYEPHIPAVVEIGIEPKRRTLQIPSRRDRVLQRLVLELLGPALDALFETSSFAWRRGLGRHSSAKAITKAFRQGYRYAVNSDFDRFFDSIEHDLLEDRLYAYVADSDAVDLIMRWVRNQGKEGSPKSEIFSPEIQPDDASTRSVYRGIPTGSPLSPLLGNLFLDDFDEQIGASGGRLVRYGDDFLILCRSEDQARQLLELAFAEADALRLRLNELQQPILPLDEPFVFLGFRFEHGDQWQIAGGDRVRLVEELGWKDASISKPQRGAPRRLPGETGGKVALGLTAIVGPEATHLEWRTGELHCHYAQGRESTEIPVSGLETLVVLGRLGLSADIVSRLCEHSITVVMADDRGLAFGMISGDESISSAVVMAQVDTARSPTTCLNIAKSTVAAKIHNYGRLAEAMLQPDEECVKALERSAERSAEAISIAELRGIEGHAAASWYGGLAKHLGPGFVFEKRVAPDAEDPVNVMLNIAHTLGYRLSQLAVRAAGLSPSIGFLHDATTRFAALASDLQEPFRFLMDRIVIDATYRLRPKDFRRSATGPYRLVIAPDAARQFQLMLWQALSLAVTCADSAIKEPSNAGAPSNEELQSGQPTCYRNWIERQSRHLRRVLLADRGSEFQPFRLP